MLTFFFFLIIVMHSISYFTLLAVTLGFVSLPGASAASAKVYDKCVTPGTFALTFDDGPYKYSWSLAEKLEAEGIAATWFVNGKNWVNVATDKVEVNGEMKTYKQVLQKVHDSGHQIASHTYSHKELAGQSNQVIRREMQKNEDVIRSAIGKRPTFMRPPAGSLDKNVLKVLGSLGYHVVLWDIDSNDWRTHNFESEQKEYKSVLDNESEKGGHIALNHEVYDQTIDELVPWVIDYVKSKNYRFVTVAECLGFPKESAYRN
ncbi:uncharacterized protein BYT42DRAFT_554168 [Radiomyces spectabilis]|uniref:uncharacterized protein n=1 Tax=Radiomyces spectabilis TaxID=64574 RepID=UPI00221EDF7A|nr:uncharacterized protein BYT42DRAFT_554168 [Radiomyces spectabilis]KAI8394308.1 hypothetical protein BYT42DRAFT_554168 [Radiomyces spectabilis]